MPGALQGLVFCWRREVSLAPRANANSATVQGLLLPVLRSSGEADTTRGTCFSSKRRCLHRLTTAPCSLCTLNLLKELKIQCWQAKAWC